jgi:sorting nexin-8
MHRGHNHTTTTNGGALPVNGSLTNPEPSRTTSSFTTASQQPVSTPDNNTRPPSGRQQSWGAYAPSSNESFRDSGIGGGGGGGNSGGFGEPSPGGNGPGNNDPAGLGRSTGTPRPVPSGVEETITISAIAEKEGMFMFQHRNYQVASARRNSKVIRRYSDFVWLLDCLHKRYPFRQLPLLPPKRVASMSLFLISPPKNQIANQSGCQ